MTSTALLRLCHLVSPALPIGAYNFSQGLEYAVHAGWVHDEASASEWIGGIARQGIGTLDIPMLFRLHAAWSATDVDGVRYWSRQIVASRESAELRAEERHLGHALAKVLVELDIEAARPWIGDDDASYATLFALAATHWSIADGDAAQGYLWSWSENQVIAAVKLLPLGQSAGQRILDRLLRDIPSVVDHARSLADADLGVAAIRQGFASALHESQYSRLFRS